MIAEPPDRYRDIVLPPLGGPPSQLCFCDAFMDRCRAWHSTTEELFVRYLHEYRLSGKRMSSGRATERDLRDYQRSRLEPPRRSGTLDEVMALAIAMDVAARGIDPWFDLVTTYATILCANPLIESLIGCEMVGREPQSLIADPDVVPALIARSWLGQHEADSNAFDTIFGQRLRSTATTLGPWIPMSVAAGPAASKMAIMREALGLSEPDPDNFLHTIDPLSGGERLLCVPLSWGVRLVPG